MDLRDLLQRQARGNLFFCLTFFLVMSDIITGSPFIQRSVANQFLKTQEAARAKHIRSAQQRGQRSALLELEGWQELIPYKKRNSIPSTDRLRTIEKLRKVRELMLQVLEDLDNREDRIGSAGDALSELRQYYKSPSERGREISSLQVLKDVSAQLKALDDSDVGDNRQIDSGSQGS